MKNIEAFFSPESVAVVGVSEDPSKLGSVVFNNMIEAGYNGKLYPINPKHDSIFGFKAYPSIFSVPGEVDLVCIVVPSQYVIDVMKDCASKKVNAAIIITAGFKESGEAGQALEDEVVSIAREAGISIIGPNCLGVIVPEKGMNASFAASTPRHGNIALLSQSGAFGTAMLDMAIPSNMGFSHFVSFGNKADVDEIDLINTWLEDDDVKVIGAYLEEIKYGHQLLMDITGSKHKKPIVLLKPGQSNEAKRAIASHTGALAGSVETFKTAVAQNGIFEAKTIRQQFNMLLGFSSSHLPKGNRVAIVTNAGGPGIIATDSLVQHGFKMAEISHVSEEKMRKVLPPTASLHNPVDVIGDALADRYNVAVHALAEDQNVDAILVLLTPQLVTQIEDTVKVLINATKVYAKPIIPVFLGQKYTAPALARFFDNKQAAYSDIDDAVEVLSALYQFSMMLESDLEAVGNEKKNVLQLAGKGLYHNDLSTAKADGLTALSDDLIKKLMEEVGIELPMQKVCSSISQAKEFARSIYPVVIKAPNSAIAHKTDFKALYLNIKNEHELELNYAELEATIRSHAGISNPEILVQEMIKFEEQMFVGSNRDGEKNVYEKHKPGFGHLIAFGQGGIYTEIYKDISYALVPALKSEIEKALAKTKISKILDGARGKEPLAKSKVIEVIDAIQKLVLLYPEIISIDINPLVVTHDRVVAVDVKVFLG